MSAPGEAEASTGTVPEESREKDCAWCKIMQNKVCRPQYDVSMRVQGNRVMSD